VHNDYHNPYDGPPGHWMRGSIHGHCREHSHCSTVPLLDGVDMYRAAGAGFMAVTDHDHVTDLTAARRRAPGMVLLEGFEHSKAENLLFVGQRVPPLHRLSLREAMSAADGHLTVVCHPGWNRRADYWTVPMILGLPRPPIGIEIFNSHYSRPLAHVADPNPLYTDIWDELLTEGARPWGFANDDFHDPMDLGKAFNMALVEEPTAPAVLRALKSGRFYASTGPCLVSVEMDADEVSVLLAAPARGRFLGPGGRVLAEEQGLRFSYRARGEGYIRFEAEAPAGLLFLQPFFRRAA
jgi:hypothetical protein